VPGVPSSPSTQPEPTTNIPTNSPDYPTIKPTHPTLPTTKPNPTKIPKPTKTPKPTATPAPPPITSDVRPGTSIDAILHDVANRMCIPYAFLMAERMEESGAWFNNLSGTETTYYNTYGWWQNADHGEVCAGLAYYTQSGIIPSDSTVAIQTGPTCNNGVQPGAYDQKIMGLFQIGEDEQNSASTKIKAVISGKVDRRVLFDDAVIFSLISISRAGDLPQTCTDWPKNTVQTVAEKHYGACAYSGGNYCNEVWNYYQQYNR